jgi:hypothetical protein
MDFDVLMRVFVCDFHGFVKELLMRVCKRPCYYSFSVIL